MAGELDLALENLAQEFSRMGKFGDLANMQSVIKAAPEIVTNPNLALMSNEAVDIASSGQTLLKSAQMAGTQSSWEPAISKLALASESSTPVPLASEVAADVGNPLLNAAFRIAAKMAGGIGLMLHSEDVGTPAEDIPFLAAQAERDAKSKLASASITTAGKLASMITKFGQPVPQSTIAESQQPPSTLEPTSQKTPEGKVIYRLKPGENLVGTFGNWQPFTDAQGNQMVIEVPRKEPQHIDIQQSVTQEVYGSNAPQLQKDLAELNKLDGTDKIEKSLAVLQNVEELMAKRLASLTTVANQQAGFNDAQRNLQLNQAEDVRTGFSARRPGSLSTQTYNAQELLNQARIASDDVLKHLIATDPEYQKLEATGKMLQRMQSQSNLYLAKSMQQEEKTSWITPDIIRNYALAYDGDISNPKAAKAAIADLALHDKTFQEVVRTSKDNVLQQLTNPDLAVRQAVFKLAARAENAFNGKPIDSTPDPNSITTYLAPLVGSREALLNKKELAKLHLDIAQAPDKKTVEGDVTRPALIAKLQEAVAQYAKDRYSNMANWQLTGDPQLAQMVSDTKAANNGKANYEDVISTYLPGNLDQAEMNRRIQVITNSFQQTTQNEKPSYILPDMKGFHMVMQQQILNRLQQTSFKQMLQKMGLVN